MQDLVENDNVERIGRHRQIEDVAVPHGAVLEPGAVEPALARAPACRATNRCPRSALDMRPEQFEHPPGSRAKIEQRTKRPVCERREDRAFHRFVGDMQAADAIPLGGMPAEIILRRAHARRAHGGQPFAVARECAIVRIEPRDQDARQFGCLALLGKTEERPRALTKPLDQPRLARAAGDDEKSAVATGAICRSGLTPSVRCRRAAQECAYASPRRRPSAPC